MGAGSSKNRTSGKSRSVVSRAGNAVRTAVRSAVSGTRRAGNAVRRAFTGTRRAQRSAKVAPAPQSAASPNIGTKIMNQINKLEADINDLEDRNEELRREARNANNSLKKHKVRQILLNRKHIQYNRTQITALYDSLKNVSFTTAVTARKAIVSQYPNANLGKINKAIREMMRNRSTVGFNTKIAGIMNNPYSVPAGKSSASSRRSPAPARRSPAPATSRSASAVSRKSKK